MSTMKRFLAYYEAFEATYLDDDWTRLEPLFSPDAVYRVTGGTQFDCEIRGREAVFAGIKKSLDGFDRQCERRLDNVAPPEVTEDAILLHGAAYYTRNGSPEFTLRLDERIEWEDGVIVRITDIYLPDLTQDSSDWLERYGADLELSYI